MQRAQKKLFLDCMVNRGSTAQGQEIDRKLLAARQARLSAGTSGKSQVVPISSGGSSSEDSYWPDDSELEAESTAMDTNAALVKDEAEEEEEEEENVTKSTPAKPTTTTSASNHTDSKVSTKSAELQAAEELDATTVMSALKFGWNACFGGSDGQGDAVTISDAALDAIIDRTRTCDSKVTELLDAAAGGKGKRGTTNKSAANVKTEGAALGLQEGQQSSVTAFEEAAPLVDLRQFEGQTVQKKQPVRNCAMLLFNFAFPFAYVPTSIFYAIIVFTTFLFCTYIFINGFNPYYRKAP